VAHWPTTDEDNVDSEGKSLRRRTRVADGARTSRVPAVERAIAILRLLENKNVDRAGRTVSSIARTLHLNKSTCSNILHALESNGFVKYDVVHKAYRLGAGLIGLSVNARNQAFPSVAVPHMQALVDKIGFTCVAFERLPTGDFVVVGSVNNWKDIKVTIDVGQRFPPSAPVFSRIALAWSSRAEVETYIAKGLLKRFTKQSKTDPDRLLEELARTRRDGYTVGIGEYYLANTIIAAPVFSVERDTCRGICTIEFTSEVSPEMIPQYALAVRDTGRAITQALREDVGNHP